MKKSKHTVITALMFTAAAVSLGALSVSCGVYGPIPSEGADTPEEGIAYRDTAEVPEILADKQGDTL